MGLIQLTLFVIYDDGLCSLCYTTNLLKDGCLASIGSPYDKDAKMGTSVLFPQYCDILHMCICKEPVNLKKRQYFDSLDAVFPAISTIINLLTSKKGWFV